MSGRILDMLLPILLLGGVAAYFMLSGSGTSSSGVPAPVAYGGGGGDYGGIATAPYGGTATAPIPSATPNWTQTNVSLSAAQQADATSLGMSAQSYADSLAASGQGAGAILSEYPGYTRVAGIVGGARWDPLSRRWY